jgi:hypothetical protein
MLNNLDTTMFNVRRLNKLLCLCAHNVKQQNKKIKIGINIQHLLISQALNHLYELDEIYLLYYISIVIPFSDCKI